MSGYTTPKPNPTIDAGRPVWPLVVDDLKSMRYVASNLVSLTIHDAHARDSAGRETYGVPLVADNGRDHAADAYQEALDGCAYWKAEVVKTGSADAMELYRSALEHALSCRRYLLERDGR